MKNNPSKSNFRSNKSKFETDTLENTEHQLNSSKKAAKSTMTEQIIMPPARVWDKIERILDEQDERRKTANKMISSSFRAVANKPKRRKVYFATVAGVSLAAGVIWFIS